jgi:uncharacterized protein YkwD
MRPPHALSVLALALSCVFAAGAAGVAAAPAGSSAPQRTETVEALMAQDAVGLAAAVNAQRTLNGLAVLQADPELAQLAQVRSQDQVARHYFSHVAPDGGTVFSLLDLAGVPWTAAGENLAQTNAPDPAQSAVDGFMQSPEHRANVLDPGYGRIGTGAASAEDGNIILTVVFTN